MNQSWTETKNVLGLNQKINKEYFQIVKGPYLMEGHTDIVRGIDICKHKKLLASGSDDKFVKLWSLADYFLIKTYESSGAVYDVVFSKEGNLLAFGGYGDYSIKLIDISDLQKNEDIYQLCGHKYSVWRLKFSNDSKYLVSGSQDGTVRVWSLDLKQEAFKFDSEGSVEGLALNSNDTLLAFNLNNYDSNENKISILDFQNKKFQCCQVAHTKGEGIQFSSDDKMLVSSDSVGIIKLWSLQELNKGRLILIRKFKASTKFIWTVLFSPCSQFIISISNQSSEIKILDSQTGAVVKEFQTKQTNNQYLVNLTISKDMDIIAYGENYNVAVWRNAQ